MRKWLLVLGLILFLFVLSKPVLAIVEVSQLDGEILPPLQVNPLTGVPQYNWRHGCSPTSGGMLVGYWDSHPSGQWSNLVAGDVSSWNNTAKEMIASPEHISDYWGTPDPNPGGHSDNCIADFMHTSRSGEGLGDGATWSSMIPQGLHDYTMWDNPATAANESYYADVWTEEVGYFSGLFGWEAFKTEIDAGNPMLLDVFEWHCSSDGWFGHSVVGYGYQENMFKIKIFDGEEWGNVTLGGFALWDTWDTSSSQSSWLGWNGETVNSYLDGNNVEWWPFLDITMANGYGYNSNYWDWAVGEGVYYHPGSPIPEPGTWFLLGSGLVGLLVFGTKKKKIV